MEHAPIRQYQNNIEPYQNTTQQQRTTTINTTWTTETQPHTYNQSNTNVNNCSNTALTQQLNKALKHTRQYNTITQHIDTKHIIQTLEITKTNNNTYSTMIQH